MALGPRFEPGSVVGGDFVIARLLGEGGMGAVYVAEQRSTGKLRALKVMHRDVAPDATLEQRFEQEAKVGALIDSGHVVEVIAAGIDATRGLPYLVMELLDGVDLRRHLRERRRLPPGEVRAIFEQLCHGVAAAHAVGLVHRDLKPENIFLARPNRAGAAGSVVKVLDFGIAKLVAERGTHVTAAVGSPLWMAPEQTVPGPVTPAADVWALGLIAYELLTGDSFWRSAGAAHATPLHLFREIVLDPIPPASERGGAWMPRGFDAWFARCVARDPADRFPDARAMWREMGPMLSGGEADEALPTARGTTDPFAHTAVASPLLPSEPPKAMAPGKTPLVLVRASEPAPRALASPAPSSRVLWIAAAAVGAVGVLTGLSIGQRREVAASTASGVVPLVVSLAPAATPSTAASLVATSAPPATATASSVANPPVTKTSAQAARSAPTRVLPLGDGFANPHDSAREGPNVDGPRISVVQGHNVRLFTRLISNHGNVADAVVRSAIDHSAWSYSQCYERAFGGAKDLPDGTVTVSFDISQQLPLHAQAESSTFGGTVMTPCVVRTLSGQTINAAGPDGEGRVTYGFRFVVAN